MKSQNDVLRKMPTQREKTISLQKQGTYTSSKIDTSLNKSEREENDYNEREPAIVIDFDS